MAELIGVISSAITLGSLATQLATSIKRLKDYLEQIRDAPDDLKWLIRDIEVSGSIVAEIDTDSVLIYHLNNKYAFAQSVRLCKDALQELDILVIDVGRDIDSSSRLQRSYAALRITMQRKKIERYKDRLKNVVQLLILSQQCYTRLVVALIQCLLG